jgi:hypothetical protein
MALRRFEDILDMTIREVAAHQRIPQGPLTTDQLASIADEMTHEAYKLAQVYAASDRGRVDAARMKAGLLEPQDYS